MCVGGGDYLGRPEARIAGSVEGLKALCKAYSRHWSQQDSHIPALGRKLVFPLSGAHPLHEFSVHTLLVTSKLPKRGVLWKAHGLEGRKGCLPGIGYREAAL